MRHALNKKRRKRSTKQKLKDKAWKAFSLWVRMRNAEHNGFTKCVTCGIEKHFSELQAGHFIPGRGNSILFDERGVHPQCYRCNINLKGNWDAYYLFMKNEYGLDVVDDLIALKRKIVIFNEEDFQKIIDKYGQGEK